MESNALIAGVLAFTLSLAAVAAVYTSWRQRGRAWLALSGWGFALASLAAWSLALGPEFGVAYAIIIFVCLTWAVVASGISAGTTGQADQRPWRGLSLPAPATLFRHAALFVLSVPATGVVAMLVTTALVIHLPWTLLTKVAVVVFLYPVLWGGYSAWIIAQRSPARPALVTAGLLVVSSLMVFL